MVGLGVLVTCGLGVKEWRSSQVVGGLDSRFNLVLIEMEKGISFVSFDPIEKMLMVLPFPRELSISSRKSGEYEVASLYKLGSYQGSGGVFVRQKVQGLMRVPIPGYVLVNGGGEKVKTQLQRGLWQSLWSRQRTSLSKWDIGVLLYRLARYRYREIGEEELLRAAVLEDKQGKLIYHADRLQEYVGTRFFDWKIGEEGVSVAIINASGEDGLGRDVAEFLTNLGMDVVMVKSAPGEEKRIRSEWQVENMKLGNRLRNIFQKLFGFGVPSIGERMEEYRAQVVLIVGEDAMELF